MDTPRIRESGRQDTSIPSRLSTTACLRCREQKLKCGRERPTCARCERLNATCIYPNPPDRRGPRTQRNPRLLHRTTERSREQTRPRRPAIQHPCNENRSQETSTLEAQATRPASRSHVAGPLGPSDHLEEGTLPRSDNGLGDISASLVTGTPVLSDSYPTQLRMMSSVATESALGSDQPPLPPTALGLSLLEIYFTRIYNAPLLFYKPVLFQQYLEGGLHGALLRALLALATLFLQPRNADEYHAAGEPAELKILSAYHSCGLPWAKAALREAMTLAMDTPSLMIIQALECLQLYWFFIGQPHSGNLCLALAYRSCDLLGYSKKFLDEDDNSEVSLESELGRRCFWACWTSTCIVMEPEPYVKLCWQEVAMVPLPGSISYTSSGCKVTLNEMMDGNWHSSFLRSRTRTDSPPGPAALLMKMVGVWAKTQLLCKDYASCPVGQNFDSAQKLSHLATSLFDDAIALRNSACQNDTTSEVQVLLLVHDALYHQCQITIHSMIVPLFSGIPTDPRIDLYTQKKSAETVTKHADLFEGLLIPYLYGRGDVSRLPPFVGYGAFIAGIVLLATEISCQNKEVNESPPAAGKRGRRLAAVEAILHLLDNLRVYWRALQRPWEYLHAALQTDISKYKKPPKPTDPRGSMSATHALATWKHNFREPNGSLGQQSAHSSDCQPAGTPERYSQPMNFSNEQPQSLVTDKSAGEGLQFSQHSPTARVNDGELEGPSEMGPSNLLESQISLSQDYDWYSLSFAEAGVEQFAGLEASTLFQQGWRTFS